MCVVERVCSRVCVCCLLVLNRRVCVVESVCAVERECVVYWYSIGEMYVSVRRQGSSTSSRQCDVTRFVKSVT